MDFSKFTFRCSSLGHIMQDPKGESNRQLYDRLKAELPQKQYALGQCSERAVKTANKLYDEIELMELKIASLENGNALDLPHLSDGCKTHLCDIYTVVKYGRTTDIKSKYLEKGLLLEEDAITDYCKLTGEYHVKNSERRKNDWIEGEADIVGKDFIVDTKVNWDIFTFNRTVARPIKPLYWWQLDGYMWLWEKQRAELAYVLLNTPEHMIVREEKKLLYELFGSDANYAAADEIEKDRYRTACSDLRHNLIYDDIPLEERVRITNVTRSEERIEKIKSRVEECRIWLNNFANKKIDEDDSNGE